MPLARRSATTRCAPPATCWPRRAGLMGELAEAGQAATRSLGQPGGSAATTGCTTRSGRRLDVALDPAGPAPPPRRLLGEMDEHAAALDAAPGTHPPDPRNRTTPPAELTDAEKAQHQAC